jgi:predicted dehydrogenase
MNVLNSGLLPDAQGTRAALVRQPFFRHERRLLVAEVLIHHLDTLRVLLGDLTVTTARLGQICSDIAGEDNALIGLTSGSGAAVTVFANMAAHGFPPTRPDEMLVLGSAGAIRLHENRLERFGRDPESLEYDLADCYQGSYDATIAHFVQAVLNGEAFETTPEDNLRTLRLVEDAYRLSGWQASGR